MKQTINMKLSSLHQGMQGALRRSLGILSIALFLLPSANAQSLIAGWDFQTTTNGGTAVLAAPNTPLVFQSNLGSGSLYLDGTNGSSAWLSTASSPQLTAFGGTAVNAGAGFSTTTTSPASMAVANSTANGKSMVFKFDMTGKGNLLVSYASQRTSTGFNSQQWDYSTDGVTWVPAQTITTIPTSFGTISLSPINGLNNISTAHLRLTVSGATNASGNNRLDNIQLNADILVAPVVATDTVFGYVGTNFSHTISATNAPTSYNAVGTEPWMSFNNTTGAITGMPVQLDTIVIATEATNAAGTGTGSTTVIILPGTQVITFDPLTPVTYGDAPFTLSATGGASGNPITFTSSDFNVATISGNTVTIVGAGTCTVTASQAGNTEYNAAADVSQSLLVNKAAQTITFGPLVTRVTTDPPFALSATGGASGNPVTYTSSNTSVATIAGNIVTIVGAGTTMITASQAGDANYLPATDVSQNQLINQAGLLPQVITFNPLPAVPYGSSTITLTATGGGSGNPITYTSSNTNVATISGNVMTILAPGTTTITASQSGNASYLDAVDESQVQLVNPAELTITGALAFNKVYDGTTNAVLFNLNLNGIIGSDLVTVSGGGTFASPNVGTAIPVTGNLILGGADSFKYTLVQPTGLSADITPASQTIVFNPIPAKTFGNAPFALSATGGGSVSPIVFTSDNPLVATIVGDSVFIIGSGTTNITASQAADANHDAAVDVTQVLTVNPANQFITFPTIPSQVVGAAPFVLNATSTSGLAITYTSSNPLVATISGDSVTIVGLGTTTITASQAGNTNYNPANNVNRVLNVTYPIIAAWDFFGVSSPATFAATTFDPQLVSSGGLNLVTRGPGAAANTATNSFRSTGFQNNGIAVTNTDYFQTTLKATPGHSLSVSSILANFAGTASFAASPGVTSQFAYSLDGTTFNLISTAFVTVATPAQSPIIDLTSIAELQNLHESKTVTFRYYASGQTATGGWGFNSPSAGVNGLAFGGDVVVCVPQTNTTSLTICNTQLPYTWGTQTLTASGTYTNTAINVAGCDSIEILNLTVNNCSNSELNLKLFIEAYWNGAGGMVPALANQGEISTATACDSITVQLRDSLTPSTIIQSVKVVLNQDGTATCSFPSVNGSYYIAVIHRNAIETWSANPVAISSTPVTYDFTTNLNKAFGDNQVEVATGVWAFYSGDIVKDFAESIDLIDLGQVEDEINNFSFGYFAEDLNGDGNVDILDTPNLESNINSFIFSNHP